MGLVPFWSKDGKAGFNTINAKAETIATSAMYREPFKRRRCLVPADAFYEWKKLDAKTKQPHAIALKNDEPFAFAGLWETWKSKDGEKMLETCTIITTDPNELMESLHDRMPVILEPHDYERWMAPADPAHLPVDLLRPFDARQMRAWPVNQDVGSVRNNRPELVEPLAG
jgi:putative SOS response-associated peptidase YedK